MFAVLTVLIVLVGAWMLVALIFRAFTKKKIGPPRWLVWLIAAPFILVFLSIGIGMIRKGNPPPSQTAWVKPDMPLTLNSDFTWTSSTSIFPRPGDPKLGWELGSYIKASTDEGDYARLMAGQPEIGMKVLLSSDGTWKYETGTNGAISN